MAIDKTVVTDISITTPKVDVNKLELNDREIDKASLTSDGSPKTVVFAKGVSDEIVKRTIAFADAITALKTKADTMLVTNNEPNQVRNNSNNSSLDVIVPINKDYMYEDAHLTYMLDPNHYERSSLFTIKDTTTVEGRRTLVFPEIISVAIPSSEKIFVYKGTEVYLPNLIAGEDYFVYACDQNDGSNNPAMIITTSATVAENYTELSCVQIGGFHTLCQKVEGKKNHSLSRWEGGSILPTSIWDLHHRPLTCGAQGMVYSEDLQIWIDIYLNSTIDRKSMSREAIQTMTNWQTTARELHKLGKRMLASDEFTNVMDGSPEQQVLNFSPNKIDIDMDFVDEDGVVIQTTMSGDIVRSVRVNDTIRGDEKTLFLDSGDNENIVGGPYGITSFNKTGFETRDEVIFTNANVKLLYEIHHCTETITASDGTVWKYNPKNGFAFCIYAGDGIAGRTVAVPFNKLPGKFWVKCRSTSGRSWIVYLKSQGGTKSCFGENVHSADEYNLDWNGTEPTTSSITLGNSSGVNTNTQDYILYGWFGDPKAHSVTSATSIVWEDRSSGISPSSSVIREFAYGDGVYVAVGEDGTILTSGNKKIWIKQTPADNFVLRFFGVAYGNGLFVAVGDSGMIQTSPNGETWTKRDGANNWTAGWYHHVLFVNGMFVIAGQNSEIQTSIDGIVWTKRTSYGGFTRNFRSIVHGNGTYVIVGDDGTIQHSPDTITWTEVSPANSYNDYLLSVTYGNNIFVAVGNLGEIQVSVDGKDWEKVTQAENYTNYFTRVRWNGSLFIVTGTEGEVQASVDGRYWVAIPVPNTPSVHWYGIMWAENEWLIGGSSSEMYSGRLGINCYNTQSDTITIKISEELSEQEYASSYDGTNYYIMTANSSTILVSTDSETWLPKTVDINYKGKFNHVAYGGGTWVVVGDLGAIYTSTDSVTWTKVQPAGAYSGIIESVVYGSGKFIMVGQYGMIQSSVDGSVWVAVPNGTGYLESFNDIAYNGSTYMVVGDEAEIQTSVDNGETWSHRTSEGYLGNFIAVYADGNEFSLVGQGSSLRIGYGYENSGSTIPTIDTELTVDNAVVRQYSNDLYDSNYIYGIAHGDGVYVTVGQDGYVYRSEDKKQWIAVAEHPTRTSADFYFKVEYLNGLFIAIGDEGKIITSPDGETWTARTGYGNLSGVQWATIGWNGSYYVLGGTSGVIQTTTDMVTFTGVANGAGYTNTFRGILWDGNRWIMVGREGAIFTSTNGSSWTKINLNTIEHLYDIAYDGKTYVAGASSGTIFRSTDGENWTSIVVDPAHAGAYVTSYWTGSMFLLASTLYADPMMKISADGTTWKTFRPIGTETVYDVTQIDQTVLCTGRHGLLQEIVIDDSNVIDYDTVRWTKEKLPFKQYGYTIGSYKDNVVVGGRDGQFFVSTDAGDTWHIVISDNGFGGLWRSICYGNGTWVAVGETGEVQYSTDMFNWTHVDIGESNWLLNVEYGNGRWNLCGLAGILYTATEVTAWTKVTQETLNGLYDIAYNGKVWVVTGDNGVIRYSENGTTWQATIWDSGLYTGIMKSVCWNGELFVAVGNSGEIQTSPDGIAWTTRSADNSFTDNFEAVVWTGKVFMVGGAAGEIQTSSDGISWVKQTSASSTSILSLTTVDDKIIIVTPDDTTDIMIGEYLNTNIDYDTLVWEDIYPSGESSALRTIAYGKGIYVFAGANGTIYTSTDKQVWTKQTLDAGFTDMVGDIKFINDTFILVGDWGEIQTSPNGIDWTRMANGLAPNWLISIAWNGTTCVVCGDNGNVYTSDKNLTTWTKRTLPSYTTLHYYSVIWDGTKFIIHGNSGAIFNSTTGTTWTLVEGGTAGYNYRNACYANGTAIAVGNLGIVKTCTDGTNWYTQTITNTGAYLYDVDWDGEKFIIVGDGGVIETSPTGGSFQDASINGNTHFHLGIRQIGDDLFILGQGEAIIGSYQEQVIDNNKVDYSTIELSGVDIDTTLDVMSVASNGSIHVAVGGYGNLLVSSDTNTWSIATPDNSFDQYFYKVFYGNGLFVAVGQNGEIQTSPNGIAWTKRVSGTTGSLLCGLHDGSQFIITGEAGKLLTSPNAVDWTISDTSTTQNLYDITYSGSIYIAVGNNGAVITSTNLTTWTTVAVSGYTNHIRGICWTGTNFIFSGSAGEIRTSTNGASWTKVANANGYVDTFYRMATNMNGVVVLIGNAGEIQISTDHGGTWTHKTNEGGYDRGFRGITYVKSKESFIIVGQGGEIQLGTHPEITSPIQSHGTDHSRMLAIDHGTGVATTIDINMVPDKLIIKKLDSNGGWLQFLRARGWDRCISLPTNLKESFIPYPLIVDGTKITIPAEWNTGSYQIEAFKESEDGFKCHITQARYNTTASTYHYDIKSDVDYISGDNSGLGWCRGRYYDMHLQLYAGKEMGSGNRSTLGLAGDTIGSVNSGVQHFTNNGITIGDSEPYKEGKAVTSYLWQTTDKISKGKTTWYTNPKSGFAYSVDTGMEMESVTGTTQIGNAGIAYGNGVWVTGGSSGQIGVSRDGYHWDIVQADAGFTAAMYKIRFLNGKFYLAGTPGVIQVSVDGYHWKQVATGLSTSWFYDITYANGMYIACGAANDIATSTNGINWTSRKAVVPGDGMYGITHNGNVFIGAGIAGAGGVSTDGITWTATTINASNTTYQLASYDGITMSVGDKGEIQTTPNGVNWFKHYVPTTAVLTEVTCYNGLWIISGHGNTIVTSTDAEHFKVHTVTSGVARNFAGICVANDLVGLPGTNFVEFMKVPIKAATGSSVTYSDQLHRTVMYGNGVHVVAGHFGCIYYSEDGMQTWERAATDNGFTGGFYNGSYLNGLFILVGMYGEIQISSDGKTWTSTLSGVQTSWFLDVTWNGTNYVVVGDTYAIYTSPNAIDWTKRTTAVVGSNILGAAYGNGVTLAAGYAGIIHYSEDAGVTWNYTDTGTCQFSNVTYGNGVFVAVGNGIYSSDDGKNWTQRTPDKNFTGNFMGATYANGVFVIDGDLGEIQTSVNGADWVRTTNEDLVRMHGYNTCWDGTQFVMACYRGHIRTSPDGYVWSNYEVPSTITYNEDVTHLPLPYNKKPKLVMRKNENVRAGYGYTIWSVASNGKIIVAGTQTGDVFVSHDGYRWTNIGIFSGFKDRLLHAAYINGKFYMIGDTGRMMHSEDGYHWSDVNTGYTGWYIDMVWSLGGLFVVVGLEGTIRYSSNLTNWYAASVEGNPTHHFRGITWDGSSAFIAVGQGGVIRRSTNGTSWTSVTSANGFSEYFCSVCFGGNKFVAVGDNNEIQYSLNAIDWFHVDCTPKRTTSFLKVKYHNGIFLACGLVGIVMRSTDGLTWTDGSTGISETAALRGLTYHREDTWFMSGDEGMVYRSDDNGLTWSPGIIGTDTWNVWADGLPVGRKLALDNTNSATADSCFNAEEPGVGYMPVSNKDLMSNNPNATHVNMVWFEPEDPAVGYHNIVTHTNGSDTVIATGVTNIVFTMIKATTGSGNWIYQDHYNWDEYGTVESGAGMTIEVNGCSVSGSNFTIPSNWESGKYALMVIGDDGSGAFKAITKTGMSETINTSGGHITGDGQRIISDIGLEDGTGVLWQDLGESGDYSSNVDTWGYTPENSNYSNRGKVIRPEEFSESGSIRKWADDGTTCVMVGDSMHIWTSTDGENWEVLEQVGPFKRGHNIAFFDVQYFDNQFIACGEVGTIMTSPDGKNWTQRTPDNNYTQMFRAISFNGTRLVAVGYSGEVQTSDDRGVTWTKRAISGITDHLTGIAHDGKYTFVIVGDSTKLYSSSDGLTWAARTPGGGFNSHLCRVEHNGQFFLATGYYGELQVSPNGYNWTRVGSGLATSWLVGILWTGKYWIVVGDTGIVYYCEPTSDLNWSWTGITVINGFTSHYWTIGKFKDKILLGGYQQAVHCTSEEQLFQNYNGRGARYSKGGGDEVRLLGGGAALHTPTQNGSESRNAGNYKSDNTGSWLTSRGCADHYSKD